MPTFDTPGPIAATVVVAGAQVRVTASDRTDTVVLVEPIDQASQSDVKVASKTKVDFADGQLSVKTTVSGDKDGSVAITIDLPAGSSLVAYLAHSGVHAEGSFGECELHVASGRVQFDRIRALQANISAGEVTIGHIAERATIDGAAFALRISEVKDTVKLTTSGGQTWIGHASADLDLSSGQRRFRHRPRRRQRHGQDRRRRHPDRPADTRSGGAVEPLRKHRGRHQRGHRGQGRRHQQARVGAQLPSIAGKP